VPSRIAWITLLFAASLHAQVSDTITVTATRTETRLTDTPSSVVVLDKETLANSAAVTLDDALRQVPGFALFRRSGSRSANPTSQGVSLRGIGASGASRAIVLDDGIPLNDPFGGWVYWGRVPRASLQRVEVLRGGASDLYGSAAMSGVVQFVRRRDDALVVDASAGSLSTQNGSLYAAMSRGEWRGTVAADLLSTDGYTLVEPRSRGLVDVNADTEHTSIDATIARKNILLRASHYDESRNNGTPLQTNDTTITQLAAGADVGALALRVFGSDQDYAQTFSSIAANRNSERLTVSQLVPSRGRGGSAQYAKPIGMRNAIVAGAELRTVHGVSDETTPAAHTRNGGMQRSSSIFVQDVIAVTPRLSVIGALRLDDWRNESSTTRTEESWSPRAAVLYRASDKLSITASAYRAFRAPTLNELYRGFRVGNVVTNANPNLGAEHLEAFELGARFANIRANAFVMNVDDTIANVTLSTTPSLITRQRQNLGSTRTRGIELEGEWRVGDHIRLSAGHLFTDATASGGKRLPQVPRNQSTLQTTFVSARATIALQARWSSMQFDDDLNQFSLSGFAVADLFASIPVRRNVAIAFAGENVFDRRVEVSATPVITLGTPRALRVGIRYSR
jgi:outer membrane receptor protein involved in Fe transport